MAERLNLQRDGVEMITYPTELRENVHEVAALWQAFCNLPPEIKQAFAATDHQSGVGYETKDGSGKNGDAKENFDYAHKGHKDLMAALSQVDSKVARDFIISIESLGVLAQPMINEFGTRIETEYGIAGFSKLARQSAPNAFFRFLHYPGERNPDAVIAEPHVDHSGFTFHLFETTDGCERLTLDTNEWLSLPVAQGQAAAFASMQTQLVSRGEVKGLCHRVVANTTSAKVGRYAIVCFIALAGIPAYDRRTHGRLQEMTPGFNYDMPQDNFEKLFRR